MNSFDEGEVLDLLCILHRDGGQYISEFGLHKAIQEAKQVALTWREDHDARAELDRRKAEEAKPKPVVRWVISGVTKAIARIEGQDIVERVWPGGVKSNGIAHFSDDIKPWSGPSDADITEERYNQIKAEYLAEEAKPKPACLDCGTVHKGNCVNTNEAKDKSRAQYWRHGNTLDGFMTIAGNIVSVMLDGKVQETSLKGQKMVCSDCLKNEITADEWVAIQRGVEPAKPAPIPVEIEPLPRQTSLDEDTEAMALMWRKINELIAAVNRLAKEEEGK